ncbi:hypothetical protein RIF23_13285 [Lipingzhangella sp. LS1_29]|uniref:Uncharacterized protein n=1 Tax=Lipingzhangella rawalii TaxID=2055835 RepID=A0ABU2H7K0_9ACTN|nr:hypothetical protein [Lipingzhangella rawalii]MDS1271270.1 hypothetical protein [Lipingzhangella rawalii]
MSATSSSSSSSSSSRPSAPQHGQSSAQGPESVDRLLELAQPPTLAQRLTAWGSRPPGRIYLPACAVVGAALLVEDSFPGRHLGSLVLAVGGGMLLALMGALRLGIALCVARPMIRRYWLRWITAPVLAATTVTLALADLPLQARVVASEDALLQQAAELNPSTTIPLDGERVGLYRLESGVHIEGPGDTETVRFDVRGAGILRSSGLAHTEDELPTGTFVPGHGGAVYKHLHGPWYSWTEY